ncbi:hypothetical protein L6452_15911 [Arctium lappa]|uniref:Uncharacterized protein n=1 Tax=Arctium lappa TaxID=4217 RepID=A0ACB9CPZ8_ARCLA|nr:hypothetical protein L6452_15911 [Arctium lappa]
MHSISTQSFSSSNFNNTLPNPNPTTIGVALDRSFSQSTLLSINSSLNRRCSRSSTTVSERATEGEREQGEEGLGLKGSIVVLQIKVIAR